MPNLSINIQDIATSTLMNVPAQPKIYHIVHVNRLHSIVEAGGLLSDARVSELKLGGEVIGMTKIKHRRLFELRLSSYADLMVGECVPFYFCPRSVMLYVIHMANHPNLDYRGGQDPIIHLVADVNVVVKWAERQQLRWAFTLSNAGSRYFEDRNNLDALSDLNWDAIQSKNWGENNYKHDKQAEFLVENFLPWELIECIGVRSAAIREKVLEIVQKCKHRPAVNIKKDWYY